MKRICLGQAIFCLAIFISMTAVAQNTLPQLGKNDLPVIVKAMTLEEKASLVVGTGMRFAGSGTVIGEADGRVPGAAGNTINLTRLGIPGTVLADGPAGVRIDPYRKADSTKTYYATAWPVGTLLASSWDTTLVNKVGVAFGNEIKEYGIDVILAPGMNIQRDPLNGRNFEYYSEDPIVTGYIAASMVKGIQSNGVGTSIKHFAANNQETNRNTINAIVSERALREIYLRGFEIAVKNAQPWTVMSSYNKINGTYTSECTDLLTKILRDEWGFKGIVMTDWYGGKDAVAQMKAGNDLIEPGNKSKSQAIIEAVNNGTLDIKILDNNVERILDYILKTPTFLKSTYSNAPDFKAHAAIARNAAAAGMVLLKNSNYALPLKRNLKLALFGNASYETVIGGTGSGQVSVAYKIRLANGLANAGYILEEDLKRSYTNHIQQDKLAHPQKTALTLGTPRMTPEWEDGSRIQFVWNKSNQWQTLSLTLDKKYTNSHWMNADEGTVIKNNGSTVTYQMAPYGTVILYAATKKSVVDNLLPVASFVTDKSKEIITLNEWNLKADSIGIKGTSLFDWKANEQLKYSSAEGIYTPSFQWNNTNTSSRFYLDLGKVCFTAEVYINGRFAGKRIYSPYMLDITQLIKQGTNQIEVRITTGQLNSYIGKAKLGDARYKQFKNKEDQLMSAGLLGPVVIREEINVPEITKSED